MGNSVTRARVRRSAGLSEAIREALDAGDWHAAEPDLDEATAALVAMVEAGLDRRGLCVADIGGNRADDDGAHRMTDPPEGWLDHQRGQVDVDPLADAYNDVHDPY